MNSRKSWPEQSLQKELLLVKEAQRQVSLSSVRSVAVLRSCFKRALAYSRPYACRYCVWTFKRRDTLANHLKRLHKKSATVARSMSLAVRRKLKSVQ
ncbi:Zinc finger and BTB domain-containing protein 41, partial [Orchesella cincta]